MSNNQNNRKLRAVKQAQKVFIVLLIGGLLLGILVSFGVVKLMNHFGLTDDSNQIEIIKDKLNENK